MPSDFKYSDKRYNRDRHNRLIDLKGVTLFKYLKNIGTKIFMRIMGALHVEGDLTVGGNNIKDYGGNTTISFDGSGGVDKIGDDTPSSGEFLKWNGSKAVWDTASGTTYSAGTLLDLSTTTFNVDLTEASAQTIVAGDYVLFLDGGTTGNHAKGSINDVATLFAGTAASTGLSASSGVLSVSDLHPVGVDGSANQLLTDDGDGTVTSESSLTYSSNTLYVGDNSSATTIKNLNETSKDSGDLYLKSGDTVTGTNLSGGDIYIQSGNSTGTGTGVINFNIPTPQSSGAGLNQTSLNVVCNMSASSAGNILQISEPGGTDNLSIKVGANGATVLTTTDGAGANGHLHFAVDGNIRLDSADCGVGDGIQILNTGIPFATFEAHHNYSVFYIYEEGDNLSHGTDLFGIQVEEHGVTTLFTADGAASGANLTIQADGDFNLTSNTNKFNKTYDFHGVRFEQTYDASDEASGTILKYSPGADETPAGSELLYLHTDGTWNQAQADDVATGASQLLAVGLGFSARTVGVLLEGFVRIASTEILNVPGSGAVDGLPVYVSDTAAGHFDFTAPSDSNDFVRIVGYAIDDDSNDVLIYFKPDNTWVQIA